MGETPINMINQYLTSYQLTVDSSLLLSTLMNQAISYSDVILRPRYSPYHHRSEANVGVTFGDRTFKLPVVPANMKCVIDINLAKWMSQNDYFYIMHRFGHGGLDLEEDNKNTIRISNNENWKTISISVGVHQRDRDLLQWSVDTDRRVDFITIDIAHGHSVAMKEMIVFINKLNFKNKPYIIAGNVATSEAMHDLISWGANMVKVGIGMGESCLTAGKTGFSSPMFSVVEECSSALHPFSFPIMADGGIRNNGDIAKALVAGATLVMAGSIFAATKDSPADTASYGGNDYKHYYGSASEYNTHSSHHIEGTLVRLPIDRWTYAEKLVEIEEDLQSSKSYAGGDFSKVEWTLNLT
jgi:GMP reductase